MSSKVIKDKIRIYVRYRLFDEETGEEIRRKTQWLTASKRRVGHEWKWTYRTEYSKFGALDWVGRYNGDREKAMDMARKLAQIVKCGKELLENDYVYDLVMVREITRRTEVSLSDNPMVVIAVAAMGD
jgi:hypothetical protein